MNIFLSQIFSLSVIILITAKFLNGALKSSGSDKNRSKSKTEANIYSLSADNLVMICEYLICPQQELGFLDRYFHDFSVLHPYQFFIAGKYKFLVLNGLKSHDSYILFKQLAFVKDADYIFDSVLDHVTKYPSSKNLDTKILINFIGNILITLSDHPDIVQSSLKRFDIISVRNLINLFMNNEAFDQFASLLLFNNSFSKRENFKKPQEIQRFIQTILAIDDSLYKIMKYRFKDDEPFDESTASPKLYNYYLNNFDTEKVKFVLNSIIVGVQESWFMDKIEVNFVLKPASFALVDLGLLYGDLRLKLHGTFIRLVNRLLNGTDDFRYCLLLYNIRFGGYIDYQYFVDECNQINLAYMQFSYVIQAAYLANQDHIIEGIYRNNCSTILKFRSSDIPLYIKVITRLFDRLSDSERQDVMDDPINFDRFINRYKIHNMDIVQDDFDIIFQFSFGTEFEGLPKTLAYNRRFKTSRTQEILDFVDYIAKPYLFVYSFHDYNSISNIFNEPRKFDLLNVLRRGFSDRECITASSATLLTISRNEDLIQLVRDFDIKFNLYINEPREYHAKLFDNSIKNLVGIYDVNYDYNGLLICFNSIKQIGNFEEFLDKDLFDRETEKILKMKMNFFYLRLLLRYLVKQRRRDLLRHALPEYLRKLAPELDSEELKILHAL